MIQRKFYLPEEMYKNLQFLAKTQKQTITDTLREILAEGIQRKQKKKKKSLAQVLVDIGRRAEKEHWRGPRDLSTNHDKYFIEAWEEEHPYMRRKKV